MEVGAKRTTNTFFQNNISSMEIYNPATDHWEYGPSMVAHEGVSK